MSRSSAAAIPATLLLFVLLGCAAPAPVEGVRFSRMDFLTAEGPADRPPALVVSRNELLADDALLVHFTPGRHADRQHSIIELRCDWNEAVLTSPLDPPTFVHKWRTGRVHLPDLKGGAVRLHLDLRGAQPGDYTISAEVFDADNAAVGRAEPATFIVSPDPWAPDGSLPTISYRGRGRGMATVVAEDEAGPPIEERMSPWAESLPVRLRGEAGAMLSAEVRYEALADVRGLRARVIFPRELAGTASTVRVRQDNRLVDYPLLNLLAGATVRWVFSLALPDPAPSGLHRATFRIEADEPRLRVDVPVMAIVVNTADN